MEIINNKLNSLPEQVEENMLNIQKLAQYLKEAYSTSQQLTTSTISITISDTNAPSSAIDGWLLDSRGLLFKINGGDGTNFLLEFYSDLKGAQGDTGAQGIPGTDGTDGTDGVDGVNGTSTRYTTEDLNTTIGYATTILKADINPNNDIIINDLIISKNGFLGKVFNIDELSVDVRTLVQLINIIDDNTPSDNTTYSSNKIDTLIAGAGKTYYKHCIYFKTTGSVMATLKIINQSNTPYDFNSLCSFLYSKGFTFGSDKYYEASGMVYVNSQVKTIIGACINGTDSIRFMYSDNGSQINHQYATYADMIKDNIIEI